MTVCLTSMLCFRSSMLLASKASKKKEMRDILSSVCVCMRERETERARSLVNISIFSSLWGNAAKTTPIHTQIHFQAHMKNTTKFCRQSSGLAEHQSPTRPKLLKYCTHIQLTWQWSSACRTQIKTITTSSADAGSSRDLSHWLPLFTRRDGRKGEKKGGSDKCVVWANCCLVDIKSSLMVGVVCAEENTTWSEQPLQLGVGGQLYQLSSEYQQHPECVPTHTYPPHQAQS